MPRLATLCALCALAAPMGARATLGEAPLASSVSATSAPRVFQARPASASVWSLRETVLDTGTTVQELVRTDGVVFAVLWSGPVLPDFAKVLGAYDAHFDTHLQQRRQLGLRGGVVFLSNTQLVLRSGGRMGHFSGHAYAPALVPPSVRMADVLP